MVPMKKQKILLMGKSGSGKTSMRSLIFTDFSVRDTWKLTPTSTQTILRELCCDYVCLVKIDKNPVKLFGSIDLQLWDCGGQESFMQSYLSEPRAEEIFSNVAAMVHVIDVSSLPMDESNFEACTSALRAHSPEAKLFILLHKSDLVSGTHSPIRELEGRLKRIALPSLAVCHFSSIWDESIYRAWSSIISSLLPSAASLTSELGRLAERCRCHEAILFESKTLLAIAHHSNRRGHGGSDGRRFEKISNILKQVRLTTSKFNSMPISLKLVLEDGTGILLERVTVDALILLVTSSEVSTLEELSQQISNFKPILDALLIDGDGVDLDPHLME